MIYRHRRPSPSFDEIYMMPIPKQALQDNRRSDQETDDLMESLKFTTVQEGDDDSQRAAKDNDASGNGLDKPVVLE